MKYLAFYLAAVNLISMIICVFDKRRAIKHGRRIRESTLMWLSVIGGAPAMYATMRIIRHKTLHKKFMIGIPLIIAVQLIVIILIFLARN